MKIDIAPGQELMMKRHLYHDRDHAFGQVMLALRSAMELTQAQLAEALNVSSRAIGDWEAGESYPKIERLKQFIVLAFEHQAFHTGHESQEIRELWQAAQQKVPLDEKWLARLLVSQVVKENESSAARTRQPATRRNATNNLPVQDTSFIGRADELSQLTEILNNPACRLLTLTGPGGIGKTRMGIEAARRQIESFADGVAFIALASVGAPNQIVSAIGNAANLSFVGHYDLTAHLLDYLHDKHMLLILDNFEHLLEGTDLVYDILQSAPDVKILVTSRERLNLRAEWLFNIEGLSYPANNEQNPLDLADYSAVELFVQRTRQVQPTFKAAPSTLETIASICQQVAGMPLAIELAAAAGDTLTVAKIEEHLRANLDALTTTLRDVPARHRSMRAVFDHSWNLLSEPERALLSRLAIFRGGCTLEAAEQVAGATFQSLKSLINKSLLRLVSTEMPPNPGRDISGDAVEDRFVLLEPIREYALEKLAARGEIETLQKLHAHFYIEFTEAAEAGWLTPKANENIKRLNYELDNLRAVLQWACGSGSSTLGLQLAGILWHFWRVRGYLGEGRAWFAELLSLDETNPSPTAHTIRLRALYGAALLATDQNDFAGAEQLIGQRTALLRALGQSDDDTSLYTNMALEARVVGQYQQATRLLEETLARQRAQNNRGTLATGGLGVSLYFLALVLREQGEFARAETFLKECVDFHTEIGERTGVAQGLLGLSDLARDQGNIVLTRSYCIQSLAIFREFGTQWAIGFGLNNLAQAAYLEGDLTQSMTLAKESLSLFRSLQSDSSLSEVLITMGHTLRAQGLFVEARQVLAEALQRAWIHGPRLMVIGAAEGLASVAVEQGHMTLAVSLLGATSAVRAEIGVPARPADQPALEQARETLRIAIGDETFESIWADAHLLTLEEIVSEVVS
jgi:predicted ATPase/transcriptional regulator with XRE-family HTH domain